MKDESLFTESHPWSSSVLTQVFVSDRGVGEVSEGRVPPPVCLSRRTELRFDPLISLFPKTEKEKTGDTDIFIRKRKNSRTTIYE